MEAAMQHEIVSHDAWVVARKQHLAAEKAFTKARDELSRQRRALPWVKIDTEYVFETPTGPRTLADLFQGRSQLIVYHFMLGPGWEQGCPSCSFLADHFDGANIHLAQRDVTLVVVSRAPLSEIEAFKKRMGWQFPWVSSQGSSFNYDFHVSFTDDEFARGKVYYNYDLEQFPSQEAPGASVFFRDTDGAVYHTYSSYGRGLDMFLGAYHFLDIVPKGRDEASLPWSMAWVRHHDRYGAEQRPVTPSDDCCHSS
jgi:predicted dithiol-disulfide oxidoreductase (DUF899 family)